MSTVCYKPSINWLNWSAAYWTYWTICDNWCCQRGKLVFAGFSRWIVAEIIQSSQFPVADWYGVFSNEMLAEACLDRLVHKSLRFELRGDSMRKKYWCEYTLSVLYNFASRLLLRADYPREISMLPFHGLPLSSVPISGLPYEYFLFSIKMRGSNG